MDFPGQVTGDQKKKRRLETYWCTACCGTGATLNLDWLPPAAEQCQRLVPATELEPLVTVPAVAVHSVVEDCRANPADTSLPMADATGDGWARGMLYNDSAEINLGEWSFLLLSASSCLFVLSLGLSRSTKVLPIYASLHRFSARNPHVTP